MLKSFLHAGFNIFRKLMAQKLRVNTQFARIVEQCRLFTFLKLRGILLHLTNYGSINSFLLKLQT